MLKYLPSFSHIYVEQDVASHPVTLRILKKFPDSVVIPVADYKDIFNRSSVSPEELHARPLILARKKNDFLYPGAPVCQSFDNPHFYYTSNIMNCCYGCEYCYLRGMYPGFGVVIFVNLEDTFRAAEMCPDRPLYLCISYDSDLYALDPITGFLGAWQKFLKSHRDIRVEVRTKAASEAGLRYFEGTDHRMILAVTLSPNYVIRTWEQGTPSLAGRLRLLRAAADQDIPLRLVFDPMIFFPGWQKAYTALPDLVFSEIDPDRILDCSVGSFRISRDYLKIMRRKDPGSAVTAFPYQLTDGYYHYPDRLEREMEETMIRTLQKRIPREKIFGWREPGP